MSATMITAVDFVSVKASWLTGFNNTQDFANIVSGVFTPVLAKHTKSFDLVDTLSVGVDRIQRNFEPLQRQVETWRKTQITDDAAKLIFYSAFVDGKLEAPEEPPARGPPALLRAAIPGILGQDHVEPVERLYQRLQKARSGAAVQGDGQAGRLSRTIAGLTTVSPFRVAIILNGSGSSSTKGGCVMRIRLAPSDKPVSGQALCR